MADSVKIRIDGDDRGFRKTLQGIEGVAKSSFKAVAVGAAAVGTAFTAITAKALNFAGELEQNIGGSEAVFKEFASTIQDAAGTAFKNMGLSASDFLATANKMGALMQGSGISIKDSADLSTKAMQRAADVASIMGIDVSMAMESIAGAAKGNFTMMDNLGVAMNATTIESYALSKGIKTTYANMDNATKIQLAMQMFLEKTTYAAGNYAKENETLAGALTTAKAALTNFMSGAGDAQAVVESLTNAEKVILKNVKDLLPKLMDGFDDIAKLLGEFLADAVVEIAEYAPEFAESAADIISSLITGINKNANTIAESAVKIVEVIATTIIDNIPLIIDTAGRLISAFATALGNSIPILKPITEIVKLFADNLNILVPAITGAALVVKAYETATKLATVAQTAFNVAASANPVGLLIGAIGAATGMVAGYLTTKREMTEEEKENADAIQSNVDALQRLKDASAEQIKNIETETAMSQNLSDELKGIVDENGRIKEGYETRAQVITHELNEALGTEMTIVDGVIQKYREQMSTIDSLIAKKRAEAIMEAERQTYTEAVSKYNAALAEQHRIQTLIAEKQAEIDDPNTSMLRTDELRGEVEALRTQLESNKTLIDEYSTTISTYDSNMEAIAQGAYDNIRSINDETAKEIGKSDTLEAAENALNKAIGVYKQGLESCERTGVEMSASMKSGIAGNIKDALEKFIELGGAIPEGIATSVENGKVTVTNSVDELFRFAQTRTSVGAETTADVMMSEWAGAITNKSFFLSDAVQNSINAAETDADAEPMEDVGVNMMTGWEKGINDNKSKVITAVKNVANEAATEAKVVLKIKSPSRVFRDEVGKMITAGIAVGIDDGKTEVQKAIRDLSDDMLDEEGKFLSESELQRRDAENESYAQRVLASKNQEELQKTIQDRALVLQKRGLDNYNNALKKAFEESLVILDAHEKDLERSKKDIIRIFEDTWDSAGDILDDFEDRRANFGNNLRNKFDLFSTTTIKVTSMPGYHLAEGGVEMEVPVLTDLEAVNDSIKIFGDRLSKLEGMVPEDLYRHILGMEPDEAGQFMTAFFNASAEQQQKFITEWEKLPDNVKNVTDSAFGTEASEVKEELTRIFGQIPEDFFGIGTESADEFGSGFMAQLSTMLADAKKIIEASFVGMLPDTVIANGILAGGGVTTIYEDNRTTNITANGVTAHDIVEEQNQNDIRQSHTRGWE